MIFNLHDQFEFLRAQGKYETMREKIMMRDEALAGSRNPMLARHGELSEARHIAGAWSRRAGAVPSIMRARERGQAMSRQTVKSPRAAATRSHGQGDSLTVIDPRGRQVADLLAFNADDLDEVISSAARSTMPRRSG